MNMAEEKMTDTPDALRNFAYAKVETYASDTLGIILNDKTRQGIREIVDIAIANKEALPSEVLFSVAREQDDRDVMTPKFQEPEGFNVPHLVPNASECTAACANGCAHREPEFVELDGGITVAKHLIDFANSMPEVDNRVSSQRAVSKRHGELKEDIKISRQITEHLAEQVGQFLLQKELARALLFDATERSVDKSTVFVDVSNQSPKDAAKRVLNIVSIHPKWEVEPIDLSTALDDTKPIIEHHIEELQAVMHTKKHADIESLPDEIRFVIPSRDLPVKEGILPTGEYVSPDEAEVTYEMTRYVHFNSMPDELKRVVRNYLSLKSGSGTRNVEHFQAAINDLKDVAARLPKDGSEKPAVVPGVGCIDPRDHSAF